jgi:hypothetical protein
MGRCSNSAVDLLGHVSARSAIFMKPSLSGAAGSWDSDSAGNRRLAVNDLQHLHTLRFAVRLVVSVFLEVPIPPSEPVARRVVDREIQIRSSVR